MAPSKPFRETCAHKAYAHIRRVSEGHDTTRTLFGWDIGKYWLKVVITWPFHGAWHRFYVRLGCYHAFTSSVRGLVPAQWFIEWYPYEKWLDTQSQSHA